MSNSGLQAEERSLATHEATLISSERTSPEQVDEVRRLVLDVDAAEVAFQMGETIGVLPPDAVEPAKTHVLHYYSVSDVPPRGERGLPRIAIGVRRWPVHAAAKTVSTSNFLCDLKPGDTLAMHGPFGLPFEVPSVPDPNLVLIGTMAGIAPFRAFVRHIYRNVPDWQGRIWLFYGARSGLEYLYVNEKDDITQFYSEETYDAFQAMCPRPNWADPIAWDLALAERSDELWSMLADPKTYVYVSGLHEIRDKLDEEFAALAGSAEKWAARKAELVAAKRWVELLY